MRDVEDDRQALEETENDIKKEGETVRERERERERERDSERERERKRERVEGEM